MLGEKIVGVMRRFVDGYDEKHGKVAPLSQCNSVKTRANARIREFSIPLDQPQCPRYGDNRCCGSCRYVYSCDYSTDCNCSNFVISALGGYEKMQIKSRYRETLRMEEDNYKKIQCMISDGLKPIELTGFEAYSLQKDKKIKIMRLIDKDNSEYNNYLTNKESVFYIKEPISIDKVEESKGEISVSYENWFDMTQFKINPAEHDFSKYVAEMKYEAKDMPYELCRNIVKISHIEADSLEEGKEYSIYLERILGCDVPHFVE